MSIPSSIPASISCTEDAIAVAEAAPGVGLTRRFSVHADRLYRPACAEILSD